MKKLKKLRKLRKLSYRENDKYKEWRNAVARRDRYCCKVCGSKDRCQAHHIIKYADSVRLRYTLSNGIYLCWTCHGKTFGQEEKYVNQFRKLISKK